VGAGGITPPPCIATSILSIFPGKHNGDDWLPVIAGTAHGPEGLGPVFGDHASVAGLFGKEKRAGEQDHGPVLLAGGPGGTPAHPEQVPGSPLQALARHLLQVARVDQVPHGRSHGDRDREPGLPAEPAGNLYKDPVPDSIRAGIGKDDFAEGGGQGLPLQPRVFLLAGAHCLSLQYSRVSTMMQDTHP